MKQPKTRRIASAWSHRVVAVSVVAILLQGVTLGVAEAALFQGELIPVGSRPYYTLVADVNGDQLPDIITSNSGSTVSILINEGGSYQPFVNYEVGSISFWVDSGDFNEDGQIDLAVANFGSDDVSILIGAGDGTFAPEVRYVGAPYAYSVAVGDLNGDAHMDLVMGTAYASELALLFGRGDGTFAPAVSLPAGAGATQAIIADANGDGVVDLSFSNAFSNDVGVSLGRGGGEFEPAVHYEVGQRPDSLAAADFDHDGHLDLATANSYSSDVSILLGRGDGTFLPESRLVAGNGAESLKAADIDADGHVDLAMANYGYGDVSVLFGRGDGTFDPEVRLPVGARGWAVDVADADGDGDKDLVHPSFDLDAVSIMHNEGRRFLRQGLIRPHGGGSAVAVTAANLNGDPFTDLVAVGPSAPNATNARVLAMLGDPDGVDVAHEIVQPGFNPRSIAAGDVDGDGRQDVVIANAASFPQVQGSLTVLKGLGNGSLELLVAMNTFFNPTAVAVGDLNADAVMDIAAAGVRTGFSGSGTIAQISRYSGVAGGIPQGIDGYLVFPRPTHVSVTDMDQDGLGDMVVISEGDQPAPGSVSAFFGDGSGHFGGGTYYFRPLLPGAAVGDLNGDEHPDVILSSNQGLAIAFNAGQRLLFVPQPVPGSLPAQAVAFGDLNNDGHGDIAAVDTVGRLSIYSGVGDGTFDARIDFAGRPDCRSIVIGDFNGDGRQDLALAGFNGVQVLLNRGAFRNRPPQAAAKAPTVSECSSPEGATVILDGAGSSDPDSTAGTRDDIVLYEWLEGYGTSSQNLLGTGETLSVTLPLGTHGITLKVTDLAGESSTAGIAVDIVDTTPPELAVSVSPRLLWPPNHRIEPIETSVIASDRCGTSTVVLVSVSSNEPDDAPGPGDGSTTGDIQDVSPATADFSLQLRSERDGTGGGRMYSVVYRATDNAGNAAETTAMVMVPHDQSGVTEPVQLSVAETTSGTVVDWTAVPGALYYNVVRGTISNIRWSSSETSLGRVTCLEASSLDSSTAGREDAAQPSPGDSFFYLVEYNDGWVSSFGEESANKPRTVESGGCQ